MPLASVTAFRALVTRARLRAGESVVITGIGGGVATCALLIATRLGARVYVTSGTPAKIDAARAHGAAGGVDHNDPDWPRAMTTLIGGRPDVVIDGAGGETLNAALDLVAPGGRVVSYGATLGPAKNVEVRRIFWKQINVLGSTMGTRRDFAAMLQSVRRRTASHCRPRIPPRRSGGGASPHGRGEAVREDRAENL